MKDRRNTGKKRSSLVIQRSNFTKAAELQTQERSSSDVHTLKHVTRGVTYSGFEVEPKLTTPGSCSVSLMCYHRRSGLDLLSLLDSTQRALPVSSTLTAGCHHRDCQSQPTETLRNRHRDVTLVQLSYQSD